MGTFRGIPQNSYQFRTNFKSYPVTSPLFSAEIWVFVLWPLFSGFKMLDNGRTRKFPGNSSFFVLTPGSCMIYFENTCILGTVELHVIVKYWWSHFLPCRLCGLVIFYVSERSRVRWQLLSTVCSRPQQQRLRRRRWPTTPPAHWTTCFSTIRSLKRFAGKWHYSPDPLMTDVLTLCFMITIYN